MVDVDFKVASIVAIVEDSVPPEIILQTLTNNNNDVALTLEALLSRKSGTTAQNQFNFKFWKPSRPSKPITLNESNVSKFLPCTLLHAILPENLADELLKEMLEQSKKWNVLPVVIFQKHLSSHHTTCLYSTKASDYFYNGSKSTPEIFTKYTSDAALIIAKKVKELYSVGGRSCLEIAGDWLPDIAVANYYKDGNDSVGLHTDKLTYIGTKPLIVSLSLGACRTFRLKHNKTDETYDILLPHNSLFVMFPPCQEEFKHSVPRIHASNKTTVGTLRPNRISGVGRICLTFRMSRSEFIPAPLCKCALPSELRPVIKENNGKYFYICGKGDCDYFQWFGIESK